MIYCPRSIVVISGMLLAACLFAYCVDRHPSPSSPTNPGIPRNEFTGSATCAGCHKDMYDSHIHTAHYLTSQLAAAYNIKGSFSPDSDKFVFSPYTTVVMEKRDSGLYQAQYDNGIEKKARRFDITVGSGAKGQTYLYWWKDSLFQLPISWFAEAAQWTNNPGYSHIAFGRPITPRCLECHSTYAWVTSPPGAKVDTYDHDILYGVGCEKCHGPGARHVQFQQQHPSEKTGKFIIDPATFTRQQKLDLCILCHGGRLENTKPAFSFQAGDTLSNYFTIDTTSQDASAIDVHGNQYGLLAASKCFRMSQMSCNTCHNTHRTETSAQIFSERCISCHQPAHAGNARFCKLTTLSPAQLKANCIDCHMPVQPSKAVIFMVQGMMMPVPAHMRTHLIKVYPDETKQFLSSVKNSK